MDRSEYESMDATTKKVPYLVILDGEQDESSLRLFQERLFTCKP